MKEEDRYYSSAIVKNKEGEIRYKIEGKYTEGFVATDCRTGKRIQLHQNHKFPQMTKDKSKTYGMNLLSYQLNSMSDNMKSKLPPTDTRLRPDLRYWEQADVDQALHWQSKLETN